MSWTYHTCFDSWTWKLNLWLCESPRFTNIWLQWLHLLSPSASKCSFLSTAGKDITGKNNFWPNQLHFPKPGFHLKQTLLNSPPINDLTPYSFKAKLPAEQENPLGSMWCKSPQTSWVTPRMELLPQNPSVLTDLWDNEPRIKCLVNLLPLGCQQWYSRVQCACRAKIQTPVFSK